jgi:hypothetical protein
MIISKELNQQFKELAKNNTEETKLFLLGKNKSGICVEALQLKQGGGCMYMPRIPIRNITKAYLKLIKNNLKPIALVRIAHLPVINWSTGDYLGGARYTHTFINYSKSTGPTGYIFIRSKNKFKSVKIKIK